jgi:Fe-S cluster biogenesis protein NfuA
MGPERDDGFSQRIERIEALVQAIERSADAATRADAQELMQAVLDLHGAGLARILEQLAEAGEAGSIVVDALVRDDLVGSLLLLHGLHPLDLATRAERALDTVRPYLRSHGGEVALLGVTDGVVRLRLQGSCHGCPSSAETMKTSIEQAIANAAPDAVAIEVEGIAESTTRPPSGFLSVDQLLVGNGQVRPERDGPTLVGPPR